MIINKYLPEASDKSLIIFVGGAMDQHYKPLFRGIYQPYLAEHSDRQHIIYAPHYARKLIRKWVNNWQQQQQPIALIGHSWGCQTIMDVANKLKEALIK